MLSPAPERRYGHAQSVFLLPEVRISSGNHLLPPACLTTKQSNHQFELGRKNNSNQQSVPPQDDH